MSISKDVVRDLLPVYVAGEASLDTRALVAEAIAADPELRSEMNGIGTVPLPDVALPAELGLTSLRRTQRLLQQRTFLAGFCYSFTTAAACLADRAQPPLWFGVPSSTWVATGCLLIGAVGWLLFLKNTIRLHGTGLQPARSIWPGLAWQCAIWLIPIASMRVMQAWIHLGLSRYWAIWVPFLGVLIAWVGWKLRQFREPEEIHRVETLFTLVRDQESDSLK